MQINDSIHTVGAVEFFQFRKKSAVFFANGGVFEQDLGQKFAHLYRMIQVGNKQDACLNYLKGLYYSEMVQMKGNSYVWQALECITEEPHKSLTFPEAAEELKRVAKNYVEELIASFPEDFDTANDTRRFARYKNELLKFSDTIISGGEATLEQLHDYFFKEIVYTNINVGERDSFENEFAANFTRWHQALGWKAAKDLEGVTAFEFFTMNKRIQENNKRK
jgi:hypothetical protein